MLKNPLFLVSQVAPRITACFCKLQLDTHSQSAHVRGIRTSTTATCPVPQGLRLLTSSYSRAMPEERTSRCHEFPISVPQQPGHGD